MILDLFKIKTVDTSNIDNLVKAYKNLNIEQSIAQMSANGVADAEIKAALASQNYTQADIEQAMAAKASNTAIQTNTAMTKANTVMKKAGAIATTLFNTALTAGISIFVSMMATGFLNWLDDLIHKEERLAEAAEKAKNKIEEISTSFSNQKKAVSDYGKEYAELAQGVDLLTNKNLSLSTEDYERFLELSNSLSDTFPTLSTRVDESGNAILDLDGNVNSIVGSLNTLIETQQRLANQEIADNLPKIYEDYYNNLEKANSKIEEQTKIQEKLNEARDVLLNSSNFYANDSESQKKYQDALDYLEFDYGVSVGKNEDGVMGMIYNVENLESDQDIVNRYNELYTQSSNNIQRYEDNLTIKLSDLNSAISSSLATEPLFDKLSSELQAGISKLFQSFDISSLPETVDSTDGNAVYNYLKSIYLYPIDQLSEEMQDKLSKAFSKPVDMSDVNYIDMVDEIQSYFDRQNIKINLDFVVADEKELQERLNNVVSNIAGDRKVDQNILTGFMNTEGIDTSDEIEFFIEVTKGAESASEAIKMYNEAVKVSTEYEIIDAEPIHEQLDSIRNAYQTVSEAIEEYKENQFLSLETVQSLLQLDDKYLQYLYDENGQLTLNREAYDALTQAQLNEMYVSVANDALNTISNLQSEEQAVALLEQQIIDSTNANWDFVKSEIAKANAILDTEAKINGEDSVAKRREYLNQLAASTEAQFNLLNETANGIKFKGFYDSPSTNTKSKTKNEFSKEFDWIANSVENVNREIDNLNEKLSNTTGFKERLKVYDDLINADERLVKTTKNAASAYEKEWNKASSKISSSYKNKIVSGESFSIETITNETTADNIDAAQEAYESWQSMLQQYNKAVAQQKDDEQGKIRVLLELEELRLDILSLENQETMSAKEKNKYIKDEETLKKNILNYNLQLAESEQEKTKLQKEYNEYLKENKELIYENNKQERDNNISYYDSRVQDIQNAIDYSETKGGQGTESQYTQMNEYIEKQKEFERQNYEAALKMRNSVDYGTDKWEEYNQQVQTAQDNIYSLTTAQIENNRAILKLPIQQLEKQNELLQEQLDILTETQEKLEDSIKISSNIVQNQIDVLTDQKEATEEYFDSQIELINEQKEALIKANEEIEHQLTLEKAQYELERAQNQKTTKIYRGGQGFVYESDQEAIRDAQEEVDNQTYNSAIYKLEIELDALEKAKEEAIDSIDTQINSLELYKERIDSITASYEQMLQLQTLISMFGADAEEKLMNGDLSIIDEMKNLYNETTSQATSLQLQIEANEKAIEQIEAYADKWNGSSKTIVSAKQLIEQTVSDNVKEIESIQQRTEAVKSINDAWEETKTKLEEELGFIQENQIIAKDEESIILGERLENIKIFSEKAAKYLREIIAALSQAESKQIELNKISAENAKIEATNSKVNNKTKTVTVETMGEKHNGLESGFVGESKSAKKDTFKYIALSELKPDEIPSLLLKGEAVVNSDQQERILDNMKNALIGGFNLAPTITPNIDLSSIKPKSESVNKTIEFNGDIVLQNVNDPDSLARKIKNEFLIKLDQEFYK